MNHIEYYKDRIQENGFFNAYIEALYFTDCGPDSEIESDCELSPDTLAKCNADCCAFVDKLIEARLFKKALDIMTPEQLGHDFWFTRNGHGVGFWDRGHGEIGETLSKICTDNFKSIDTYQGDDGLIYFG